jgi:hypothetical protein
VASPFYLSALAGALLCSGPTTALPPSKSAERPLLELRAGEKYFRAAGRPAFVLGRNPVGKNPQAYAAHFRRAAAAGERFLRIHFTYSPRSEKAGEIAPAVLKGWDQILDAADEHGLSVLPVLGVWADWNDGSHKETWHAWDQNPFNAARGGPAKRPQELFDDTPCRRLWLKRLATIVKHWSKRRAIVAWEVFSELDLVTGATEERAVDFIQRAAGVVRAADPWKRPVTASQAGINEWPKVLRSAALDFIQVHPYAGGNFGGRLDGMILSVVRLRLKKYGKPVLLGECGLDSAPPRCTLDAAAQAQVGVRHAIWASVVSGAMNGRMLWWQDGYDQFEKADLCRHYHDAAAPAAAFVRGVDFTGFEPIQCDLPARLKGALIGNNKLRLGWFRDARCGPPKWPMNPLAGQTVTLSASGKSWRVEFFDTATGRTMARKEVSVRKKCLRITLPEFRGSIAAQIKRLDRKVFIEEGHSRHRTAAPFRKFALFPGDLLLTLLQSLTNLAFWSWKAPGCWYTR